jgi:hypothetical protein
MRTAFFWAVAQRVVAIPYRRFGTTCRTLPKRRVRKVVQKRRYGIITTRCVRAQKNAVLIYFAGEASNHSQSKRFNLRSAIRTAAF